MSVTLIPLIPGIPKILLSKQSFRAARGRLYGEAPPYHARHERLPSVMAPCAA